MRRRKNTQRESQKSSIFADFFSLIAEVMGVAIGIINH